MYDAQKPKAYTLKIEISIVMKCKKPNEKLQGSVIKSLWEVIYAYFYNWEWSLYLMLIVYALVELIIETSC